MAKKKDIDEEILGEEKKEFKGNSIIDLINKKEGRILAYNLEKENPTEVKDWISTGSRWLDSIICNGKLSGIPIGKVTEICGETAAGKSYMAAQIAANAQKKGMDIVYFDSESAIDPEFLVRIGIDLNRFTYVQADSTEFVLSTIEHLLINSKKPLLYCWDSLVATATKENIEKGSYDPQSSMAYQPRVMSIGFKKLTIPLANANSALLILNQLRTNIGQGPYGDPFFVPGGKAVGYACSLIIYLTASKSQKNFIREGENEKGDIIGTSLKASIKKSRFGSYGRQAEFDILWTGPKVSIMDEESWLEAIKGSEFLKQGGAWFSLVMEDNSEIKFQGENGFLEKLKDEKFKERVLQIMDQYLIYKNKPILDLDIPL